MARSVMKHRFSEVPDVKIPRSQLNRSHGYKTTFDAGYLVPVYVDEVLPGDTFNLRMAAFGRLATPIHPIMDNMFLESFFFFVPLRLVWDNFEKFMGEQTDPGDSTDYTVPVIPALSALATGSIFDYMGLPIDDANMTQAINFNGLHFRAYNLIWNEWFRDQNLQDSVDVDTDDGPDSATQYSLLRRGKRHDYFTSCLPWPQKGDSVIMPLSGSAPVVGIGKDILDDSYSVIDQGVDESDGVGGVYARSSRISTDGADWYIEGTGATGDPAIFADLTNATASTINELRQAFSGSEDA